MNRRQYPQTQLTSEHVFASGGEFTEMHANSLEGKVGEVLGVPRTREQLEEDYLKGSQSVTF